MSLVPCPMSLVPRVGRGGIALVVRSLTLAGILVAVIFLAIPSSRAQEPQPTPPAGGENAETPDTSGWPTYPLPTAKQFGKDHSVGRGPGFYLNFFKLGLVWALFVLWVKTTDWVSQDCLRVNLNYAVWNTVIFGVFAAAFVLIWILPWFEVALPLLLVAYLAPLGTFLIIRNRAVQPHQRVMTPDHLRHVFADAASKLGVKVQTEKQAAWQK